ncbi:MAG TPA: DUF3568 family protein [Thermodesulfobacteriota bacterium]|nr:DUF3568 family protein [Thermodesulfobacteriota bacterium]
MNYKKCLIMAILGISLLLNTGCAAVLLGGAAAAGAGTILYVKGESQSTDDVSIDKAWRATILAVDDLGFVVTSKEKDAVSARLTALTADNKEVKITLNRKADKVTQIAIRVGTLGDESLSRLILDKIREHY